MTDLQQWHRMHSEWQQRTEQQLKVQTATAAVTAMLYLIVINQLISRSLS